MFGIRVAKSLILRLIVIDRASFLRLGAASALGLLAVPAVAQAQQTLPLPSPQGDDLGFLQFEILAERVALDAFRAARKHPGFWSAPEREQLRTALVQTAAHISQLTVAMGANAPEPDDYAVNLPAGAFASRRSTLSFLERLEQLLVGVNVSGAAFSADSATRLLIARMLADNAQILSTLRAMHGSPLVSALPNPIDLEAAGNQLDTLLQANGYPS